MLLTIGEIIRRFRTEGACIKFSPKTITHMADVIGYHIQRRGGKVGYDQSLITAITQRFKEAVEYEKSLKVKQPQKPLKQPKMGDYYAYNGERDNIDYDWEKNENRNMNKKLMVEGPETINNLNLAIKLIKEQWSSPNDYWYVKILQRQKDNDKVIDGEGNPIFVPRKGKNSKAWIDGDKHANRIGYTIIMGNTLDEAINSLLNATVTIFDSWVDFVGNKKISCNDNNMGSIIQICRMFNARAYMSLYKRSYNVFKNKDANRRFITPRPIQNLIGKTDPISRERVFDHVNNHDDDNSTPYWLIDCDDENKWMQQKVIEFLKKEYNITPFNTYETHNGIHFLVDLSRAIKKDGNVIQNKNEMNIIANEINHYLENLYTKDIKSKSIKRGQDVPIELKQNQSIILFSEVGLPGRNVSHPEWQTKLEYPELELRRKSRRVNKPKSYAIENKRINIKSVVENVLKEFIKKEIL